MFNLKKGLLQFLPTLKDGVSLQSYYENEAEERVEDYLIPIWDYNFAVYAPYGMRSSEPMNGKEMQERINATAKDSWLKH